MAVCKVTLNNTTLIDVSSDTVTANVLLSPYTATNKVGAKITGSCPEPGLDIDENGYLYEANLEIDEDNMIFVDDGGI